MRTVIHIKEENHGFIGVATDYKSALLYLFNNHWIDDNTEICIGNDDRSYNWKKVSEVFGEDWRDKMMKWDILDFNDCWEGSFHLSIEDVISII